MWDDGGSMVRSRGAMQQNNCLTALTELSSSNEKKGTNKWDLALSVEIATTRLKLEAFWYRPTNLWGDHTAMLDHNDYVLMHVSLDVLLVSISTG